LGNWWKVMGLPSAATDAGSLAKSGRLCRNEDGLAMECQPVVSLSRPQTAVRRCLRMVFVARTLAEWHLLHVAFALRAVGDRKMCGASSDRPKMQ
jgi:hypothetical protein